MQMAGGYFSCTLGLGTRIEQDRPTLENMIICDAADRDPSFLESVIEDDDI